MRKHSILTLAGFALALTFSACTKEKSIPRGEDGKPLVSREADPNRVVFEAELDVPSDLRSKVKKTDLMIWDLKDVNGEVVSAQITPVPLFPAKLVVTAKQLFDPVPEGAKLLFSARIVKFGDEGKLPVKGQLQVLLGMEAQQGATVENKAVNQKLLDKFMKKLKIVPSQELSVGAKTKAEFAPSLM